MYRLAIILFVGITTPAGLLAQDPPPGGLDYDVQLHRLWSSASDGTFVFSEDNTTDSGDFEATLGDSVLNGTWYAFQFGSFSFWIAGAESDSEDLFCYGFATSDSLYGRAYYLSGNSFWWFFWRGYRLRGEVPMTESTAPTTPETTP